MRAHFQEPSVAVIGGGVIGLTSAIRLQEAGLDVRVLDAGVGMSACSPNAGAIWGPFLSPKEPRLEQWSYVTRRQLERDSLNADSGVQVLSGIGAERETFGEAWWVEDLFQSEPCDPNELPFGFHRGWRYSAPVIDVPKYLKYLRAVLERAGGAIRQARVNALAEVSPSTDIVVVCAGADSNCFFADEELSRSKGELVVVENPGLREFFCERGDGPDLTYLLPQGSKLVLGGTAEPEGSFLDLSASPTSTRDIVGRCADLFPEVGNARILESRVGFRPCRPSVRIKREDHVGTSQIYSNYGHAGSGFSLAWGCADTVAELVVKDLEA